MARPGVEDGETVCRLGE